MIEIDFANNQQMCNRVEVKIFTDKHFGIPDIIRVSRLKLKDSERGVKISRLENISQLTFIFHC